MKQHFGIVLTVIVYDSNIVYADDTPCGSTPSTYLFHSNGVRQIVESCATKLNWDVDRHHSQVTELFYLKHEIYVCLQDSCSIRLFAQD